MHTRAESEGLGAAMEYGPNPVGAETRGEPREPPLGDPRGGVRGEKPGEISGQSALEEREALQAPALQEWTEADWAVPRSRPETLLEGTRRMSIRVPVKPTIARCELCSKIFPAQGPTGFYEDWPICDRCLLENENQLGMVMALTLFTRTYARLAGEDGAMSADAATEMLAFAKVYELFADAFGPPRPLDFAGLGVFGKKA